jgi:hypothetical protein
VISRIVLLPAEEAEKPNHGHNLVSCQLFVFVVNWVAGSLN